MTGSVCVFTGVFIHYFNVNFATCIQILWTSAVFKDPVPVILDMLTDSLLSLDPSLSSSFVTYLQQHPDTLDSLVDLKQVPICFLLFN